MQCPKCKHRIPDNSDRCLYCGARIGDEISPGTCTDATPLSASPGKTGKNLHGVQPAGEGIDYKKLEGLPLSLRAKVEEALTKGEGRSEEKKNPLHNLPAALGGTGRKKKRMGPLAALRILLKKD